MPEDISKSAWVKHRNDRLWRHVQELQDKQAEFIKMAEGLLVGVLESVEAGEIFIIESIDIERVETTRMEDRAPAFILDRVRVSVRRVV